MTVIIYMAINIVNGKKYIGITKQTLKQRVSIHLSNARCGKGSRFSRAIRKHGEDSFLFFMIKTVESYEEALKELNKNDK